MIKTGGKKLVIWFSLNPNKLLTKQLLAFVVSLINPSVVDLIISLNPNIKEGGDQVRNKELIPNKLEPEYLQ